MKYHFVMNNYELSNSVQSCNVSEDRFTFTAKMMFRFLKFQPDSFERSADASTQITLASFSPGRSFVNKAGNF